MTKEEKIGLAIFILLLLTVVSWFIATSDEERLFANIVAIAITGILVILVRSSK